MKAPPSAKTANGRSGSPTSAAPPEPSPAPSPNTNDLAARHAAVEKILVLFYAAYDREPPEGAEKKVKIGVWASALENVPTSQLLPLARQELRERESAFLPVPADLLRRWTASRSYTPEGAPNPDAYLPYVPAKVPALPQPLPPLQIEPAELKRRLGLLPPSQTASATPKSLPEPNQRWSGFLLDIARAGNIDLDLCSPEQIAALRTFGRWWLANFPTHDLLLADFASSYANFSASRDI